MFPQKDLSSMACVGRLARNKKYAPILQLYQFYKTMYYVDFYKLHFSRKVKKRKTLTISKITILKTNQFLKHNVNSMFLAFYILPNK